jgi:Tfp pilus assembly protein PilF
MESRIDQLRQKLREEPASRQFFQLGDLLRKANELDEAAQILQAGLVHFPRYVAAWISLGRVELARENFDSADDAFSQALKLDPANGVAARLVGETALQRGDLFNAHKAFKLAIVLAPQDEEVELALARVETKLAEAGHEPGYDTQDVVLEVASQWREQEALIALESQPKAEDSPVGSFDSAPEAVGPAPTEVFAVSEGDPFDAGPRGTTGDWSSPDDVFSAVEADPRATEPGTPYEDLVEDESPFTQEKATHDEEAHQAERDQMVAIESEYDGLPVPTVTLARLALEQGDLALARKTAQAVLERDPSSYEAQKLLTEINGGDDVAHLDQRVTLAIEIPGGISGRTIVALQSWLEGIRLASEQRAP